MCNHILAVARLMEVVRRIGDWPCISSKMGGGVKERCEEDGSLYISSIPKFWKD
jgi:hypothetical protein